VRTVWPTSPRALDWQRNRGAQNGDHDFVEAQGQSERIDFGQGRRSAFRYCAGIAAETVVKMARLALARLRGHVWRNGKTEQYDSFNDRPADVSLMAQAMTAMKAVSAEQLRQAPFHRLRQL
jgi:hypothetical protein